MKTERLRHVGENPTPLTIFKKEVKPVRNPVLRCSGLLACLNDRFLVDTKQEIMFGNGCENGGVCLLFPQTMMSK